MSGLFSRSPDRHAVRPLLGAALLSSVEAMLILPLASVPALLRLGAAGILLLTTIAIAAGLRGDHPIAGDQDARR